MTSVLVSHDVEETLGIADHVVILANAKVAIQGTPAEVRASSDPLIQQFIGGEADGPVRFHYPAPGPKTDFLGEGSP